MYSAFWVRVNEVIGSSLFGKLFLWLVHNIGGAFKASAFYSFFTSRSMGDRAGAALIPSFMRKLLFKSWFTDMVSQSALVNLVCSAPKEVLSSPLAVFSWYLIPSSFLLFLRNFGNVAYMSIFAACFIIGLLTLRFRVTVGSLIGSSFVFGGICKFFDIKTDYELNRSPIKVYIFAALLGIAVGAVSFVGGDIIMLAAFVGCLFIPLLLDSPLLLMSLTVLGGVALSTFPAFALSLVTFVVVLCRLFTGRESLPKFRPMYILTALYALITVYHVFNGFGGSDSMLAGTIQVVLLLLFFSAVTVLNNIDKFRKFVFAISACSIFSSFYGLYQFISGQGGTGWADSEVYEGGLSRIVSTFANPNVYGEYLIIVICITLLSLLISQNARQRIFFVVCLALQLVNLALTYSRGCYIAVILAVLIIVWCCDKRLLGAGVFALPVLPYVLPQNIITRILSVGSYLKDTSVSYRFSIWNASMKIINNHWYVGSGVGTVAFTAFYQDYMLPGVVAQHSHNWYMQITIEMSVVALAVLLLIFYYAVKDVSHTVKNNNSLECRFILIPLIAAVVGIILEGFVDYIFYNNVIYMMFWTVLALLVAGLNICDKELQNEKL